MCHGVTVCANAYPVGMHCVQRSVQWIARVHVAARGVVELILIAYAAGITRVDCGMSLV